MESRRAVSKEDVCSFRHDDLLRDRGHKVNEEVFRKGKPSEAVVLEDGKIRKRADISSKETVRIRHVIIGILPYVKKDKSESGCIFGEKVRISSTLKLAVSLTRSRRKGVEKDHLLY